jgi:lipid A 3-O-deacylase
MLARRFLPCILLPLLAAAQPGSAEPTSPYLTLAVGHVAVLDSDIPDPVVYKIEYRFAPRWKWQLAPSVGVARSENGASFIFADLERDFFLGKHWVLSPSLGLGSFDDGKDVKLGNDLEFRSGLKIAYQFSNDWRVAVGLFHLSNGGLGDRNPGTEPVFIGVSIPL